MQCSPSANAAQQRRIGIRDRLAGGLLGCRAGVVLNYKNLLTARPGEKVATDTTGARL